MPTKVAALMLAAFAALGCESPEKMVYAEHAIRLESEHAVDAWNRELGSRCPAVGFSMTDDRAEADVWISIGDAPDDDCEGECMGAEVQGDVIIDYEGLEASPETIPAVIAHELGHVLGIGHSRDPRDLMFAPVSEGRTPVPTARDAERACDAWGF